MRAIQQEQHRHHHHHQYQQADSSSSTADRMTSPRAHTNKVSYWRRAARAQRHCLLLQRTEAIPPPTHVTYGTGQLCLTLDKSCLSPLQHRPSVTFNLSTTVLTSAAATPNARLMAVKAACLSNNAITTIQNLFPHNLYNYAASYKRIRAPPTPCNCSLEPELITSICCGFVTVQVERHLVGI